MASADLTTPESLTSGFCEGTPDIVHEVLEASFRRKNASTTSDSLVGRNQRSACMAT